MFQFGIGLTALFFAAARHAEAAEDAACMAAYKSAEGAERNGNLQEAHKLLSRCAQKKCGALLYQKCGQQWVKLGKALQEGGAAKAPSAHKASSSPLDLLETPAAAAAPAPKGIPVCMEAYKGAEKAEQENRLREAHELLRGCAKKKCGAFLYQQCWPPPTRRANP
jgi:hypothetical protein